MALNNAQASWNANTEPDLAFYTVHWGLFPNQWDSFIVVGTSEVTINLPANVFNSDGLWFFAINATDTSNNKSAKSTAVSKRIVRTQSGIRHVR